ncbi:GerMN domain-containing protein [Arthrobacter celericrescens]|uniref:GerMN domain-containing protein n=1 Tax=Arthrobacter celericrescens TaxID=2320851 RepID=UPI000EA0BFA0|nr:GerMN domain-containing protein [Arthrobacter celericrescens]
MRGFGRSTAGAPPRGGLAFGSLLACGLVFGLGGCAYPASLAPGPTLPAAITASSPAVTAPPALPAGSVPATSSAAPPAAEPAAPGATSPGAGGHTIPATPPAAVSPGVPPVAPSTGATPTATAGASPGSRTGAPEDLTVLTGPAIYLVAIDDGGRRGARFGCNDSLVAVHSVPGQPGQASTGTSAASPDPVETVMTRLLAPDAVPAGSGLYSALAASALTYVSGRLDGATAVVDFRGELRQGGVCDSPRIDAQLTQTAIAATGASRADIRINGRPLAEFLDLR